MLMLYILIDYLCFVLSGLSSGDNVFTLLNCLDLWKGSVIWIYLISFVQQYIPEAIVLNCLWTFFNQMFKIWFCLLLHCCLELSAWQCLKTSTTECCKCKLQMYCFIGFYARCTLSGRYFLLFFGILCVDVCFACLPIKIDN